MKGASQPSAEAPAPGRPETGAEATGARSLALCTDILSLSLVLLLLSLALAFPSRVAQWGAVAARLMAAGVLFGAGAGLSRRAPARFRSLLHFALVFALFGFLFEVMASLQHVFVEGWLDPRLLAAEFALTGTEATRWVEPLVRPALTEWMMFAYVVYLPLLPLVAFLCYQSAGERAVEVYGLLLAATYAACYVGFLAFPVAGPFNWQPAAYTVPLKGWVFTQCAEWIRTHQHYPGGNFPSPHCAAGTVILVVLARYRRVFFFAVGLPIVLSLYAATVYGRFHYVWDGIVGILVALLICKLGLRLIPRLEAAVARPEPRRRSRPSSWSEG